MDLITKILHKFRCRRALRADGVCVETQFVLHLNNDEPRYFISKSDLIEFLNRYSETNKIFAIHMFRVDCFSLM